MQRLALPFIDRRGFLRIGSLGLLAGGWGSGVARAAGPVAKRSPIRACILLFQYGGPSHLDTFDLKPEAPPEIRGEFQSIATAAPGVRIGEHLPLLAQRMDKIALIRSMTHRATLHDAASIHALTGRPLDGPDRELFAPLPQFYPCHGSVVAKYRPPQPTDGEVRSASLPFVFHNVVPTPAQGGGILGQAVDPLRIEVDLPGRRYQVESLLPAPDLGKTRLSDRSRLLKSLDQVLTVQGSLDTYYDRAYRLLESEKIHRALDITQEPPETRERYGWGSGAASDVGYAHEMRGQNLLLARRLVEAGVPFVTVYDYRQQGQNWDAHAQCFQQLKSHLLPPFDRGVSALMDDLEQRGLLDSTLIIAMGEFGRTPVINGSGGRDHWPNCYSVLLAGGGIRGGTVYGSSDSRGAYPDTDPVTPGDLAATIYHRFGIDPHTDILDPTGRPHRMAIGDPLDRLFA